MPTRSGGTGLASKATPNRPIWSRWRERAPEAERRSGRAARSDGRSRAAARGGGAGLEEEQLRKEEMALVRAAAEWHGPRAEDEQRRGSDTGSTSERARAVAAAARTVHWDPEERARDHDYRGPSPTDTSASWASSRDVPSTGVHVAPLVRLTLPWTRRHGPSTCDLVSHRMRVGNEGARGVVRQARAPPGRYFLGALPRASRGVWRAGACGRPSAAQVEHISPFP